MRISTRAQRIEPFYVMEVAKAASAMARDVAHTDAPMIFLNIGEPDFTAPPLVQEAAARAIQDGATQYTPSLGLEALRTQFGCRLLGRLRITVGHDDLHAGCSQAMADISTDAHGATGDESHTLLAG